MTAHAPVSAASVEAVLNFLKPMTARLISYQDEPPPGVPKRNGEDEPNVAAIREARPLAEGPSLESGG